MPEFNVLIVDDEDDFREILVKRLRKRNLDVQGVESGQKALDLLDKVRIDVVILDVKMPGKDGLETLQEIKRKQPLIEVIMLTGHGSDEMGIQGMKLGAFEYLMKPADITNLIEKMRRAYKKKFFHAEQILHQAKEPTADAGQNELHPQQAAGYQQQKKSKLKGNAASCGE